MTGTPRERTDNQGDSRKRLELGKATAERVMSAATLSQSRSAAQVLLPELSELSDEYNWGSIWSRDVLSLQNRSMVVISSLLTQGKFPYARTHIGAARNLGISRDEVVELIFQLLFYTGLPTVQEGLKLVADVYGTEIVEDSADGSAHE
jgi:4-carboxymuconolactone decarboxylase